MKNFNFVICPSCKSDGLKERGGSMKTLMYFPPLICKAGFNLNPDMNRVITTYLCKDCGQQYTVDETPDYKIPCTTCDLECKDRRKDDNNE